MASKSKSVDARFRLARDQIQRAVKIGVVPSLVDAEQISENP